MYATEMTTRQISETLMDLYSFEASEGFISDVTDKLLPQIEEWQNRPLDEIYPILCMDAIHYSVRDNGMIRKLAVYFVQIANGEMELKIPRDRDGDFEPQLVKKHQADISTIEDKVIFLYAQGVSTGVEILN